MKVLSGLGRHPASQAGAAATVINQLLLWGALAAARCLPTPSRPRGRVCFSRLSPSSSQTTGCAGAEHRTALRLAAAEEEEEEEEEGGGGKTVLLLPQQQQLGLRRRVAEEEVEVVVVVVEAILLLLRTHRTLFPRAQRRPHQMRMWLHQARPRLPPPPPPQRLPFRTRLGAPW